MKTTMKKIKKGFSLVELMVVIAIIAILAAVAIPMYSNYTTRAELGSALAAVGGVKAEVAEAIANNGGVANGITAPSTLDSGTTVSTTTGAITVDTSGILAGTSLTLTPAVGSSSMTWDCTNVGISTSQAPAGC